VPEFTVAGDPGAIRAQAETMRAKADMFLGTAEALAKVTTDGWHGRAADHFRDAFDVEPQRWYDAGDGFVRAAWSLEVYADAVADAQRRAAWAEGEYARGEQATADARAAYDADVARARQEAADAAARGQLMTLTIVPFEDPGEAVRQGAVAEYEAARAELDSAADACADGVRSGCSAAPEERSWLESGLAAVGGFFAGAGEATWDLLTLPGSPISLLSDGLDLATGHLTPEEMAVKYRLKVETVGDMLNALAEDPVAFGENLGKALLDWDTWADDPARALGHLVPDAVAAVFTAGAGTAATRGAKGAADVADAAGDLASAGNRLDDLSDLGHLDDAGGLSRLDDASDLGRVELTEAEQRGLDFYTGFGYDHVNSYLRGADNALGADIFPPEQLARYADDISAGLDRLPQYDGQTFRGTDLPDSVLAEIDRSGRFSDDAFLSSSTDLHVAERFRAGQGGNALLHIDGFSGRDVKALSQFGDEAEVLFDKGTEFEVVNKTWNEQGYWDIFVREPR